MPLQNELQRVADKLRTSTKQLCRNLKDNPNVAENMLKVASERQALALLLSNCLNELEVYSKAQPIIESVMAQEAADVQMKETIEHERLTTAAVRQLRTDLREEKVDHEEKVRVPGPCHARHAAVKRAVTPVLCACMPQACSDTGAACLMHA